MNYQKKKKTIPLKNSMKKKFLGVSLTKVVKDLDTEKQTLMKEM